MPHSFLPLDCLVLLLVTEVAVYYGAFLCFTKDMIRFRRTTTLLKLFLLHYTTFFPLFSYFFPQVSIELLASIAIRVHAYTW